MKKFCISALFYIASVLFGAEAQDSPSTRIIGGQPAPNGTAPFMASLVTEGLFHFCGGAIINRKWVLTAEHCLHVDNTHVAVGSNYLNKPNVVIKALRKIGHPEHDIGLIEVESNFPFGRLIRAINLPRANLPDGSSLRLYGWGANKYENGQATRVDALQMLDTFSISNEQCSEVYKDVTYDRDLCTLKGRGQGACYGDSGSPYVSGGQVHAVTSRVVPCAVGVQDFNTRVFTHLSWIRQVIG